MAAGRCTIARSAISNTGVRYEVVMGDTKKPSAQRGESVTTRVSESDTKSDSTEDSGDDLQALIEQAEAEAAEAEAAAAAARARVRALRSDDDAATEAGQAPRPWYRRVPRRSTVAKALAALVTVGCLIASGVIVWRHHTASEQRQRSEQFTAAAREGIVALTSLNFNHAKQDVQRIIDNSTGSFRDDFQARADDFVKVVETSKVVAQGTVKATAVQSMSDDSAVVLVVAEEQITNSAGAKKDPRVLRLSVTVTRDGERFKLAKVELVP
jgi:Mce-associated membrane protein